MAYEINLLFASTILATLTEVEMGVPTMIRGVASISVSLTCKGEVFCCVAMGWSVCRAVASLFPAFFARDIFITGDSGHLRRYNIAAMVAAGPRSTAVYSLLQIHS